jgi:hypothetical protein
MRWCCRAYSWRQASASRDSGAALLFRMGEFERCDGSPDDLLSLRSSCSAENRERSARA